MTFKPFLSVLSKEQRELWPAFREVPDSFVLYGGAAVALYGQQFPPMEAVKALGYFDEGDAANVDAETRRFLSQQAEAWDCTVARIAKSGDSLV